ncbi:hypothetical protein HZS_4487 [Henneguya salminicola]|nr:hypothetical protein HZS_4487 [Henneguya salminicola]
MARKIENTQLDQLQEKVWRKAGHERSSPRDGFNVNETELYWCALQDGTFSFKNDKAPGSKIAKNRMTLPLECNIDGSEKNRPVDDWQKHKSKMFKKCEKTSF